MIKEITKKFYTSDEGGPEFETKEDAEKYEVSMKFHREIDDLDKNPDFVLIDDSCDSSEPDSREVATDPIDATSIDQINTVTIIDRGKLVHVLTYQRKPKDDSVDKS